MKLKYLYVEDYKQLIKTEIKFETESENLDLYKDYYPNLYFNVLVGENGVGKTTVMSFISRIFHYLERFHDKIDSDFILIYEITLENEDVDVTIRKNGYDIFFMAENYIDESILMQWSPYRKKDKPRPHQLNHKSFVTYEQIKCFLSQNVITSVFSIHGEYPEGRNNNYLGHKMLEVYKISDVYGSNHYRIKSLSKGIAKFVRLCKYNNKVMNLLEILNLKFTFKTTVHLNCNDYFVRAFGYEPWREFIENLGHNAWVEFFHIFNNGYHKDESEFLWNWATHPENEEDYDYNDLDFLNYSFNIDINELFTLEEKYKIDVIAKLIDNQLAHFNDIYFIKENSYETSLVSMSSGEKMFFVRILSLLTSIENNSLIIIEEPELHLNPSWTKQIISMIELLFGEYKANFIIATHSYSFINSLFPDNILLMAGGTIENPKINTFLANEREITNNLFKNSRCYNYVENKLVYKLENATIEELQDMMEYLGESYYSFLVYKKILKLKEVQ